MHINHNPDKYKGVILENEDGSPSGYSSVLRTEEEYREARKQTLQKAREEHEKALSNINKELELIERGVTPPSFYNI
jgi:hypothetical protein